MRPLRIVIVPLVAGVAGAACGNAAATITGADASVDAQADVAIEHTRIPYVGLPTPEAGPRTAVAAEITSSRVDTMQLMFAAGEMQTSGEPFASGFAGRNLLDYDRYYLPPDQYLIKVSNGVSFFVTTTDLFGFSTAVESYEYSKYHVIMVGLQTGAGVSLANGPVLARAPAAPGATPRDRLKDRMGTLIAASGANIGGAGTTMSLAFATLPPPPDNPLNDFGFPGLWPALDPYRSFDPTMQPATGAVTSCTSAGGYGGLQMFAGNPVPPYECSYNSLHLTDRLAQTEHVVTPGALGYTTWKEALWAIDFTGRLHDSSAGQVAAVSPADVAQVGRPGNTVQATDPANASPGVYVGSTPLEGLWGLAMTDEMDNAAAWLLGSLATTDGKRLSGFSTVEAAIAYDYASPLVWFPAAVAVTEDGHAPYPGVASLTVQDATSRAVDLAALAQGFSLMFGMTDARNADVGQQTGLAIAFGGYVFPSDDGAPDGEDTAHDRALGAMRTAFVDLDRMHVEPATGVVIDTATVAGGTVTRGALASTTTLGHVVVALRHLLMACNASVTQYGAPDPDPARDALGILESVPIHPTAAGAATTFSPRVRQLLVGQAAFVRDVLTRAEGTVANGATLSSGQWVVDASPSSLEAQGAALRVLVEAYRLTRDATYLARAGAVARRLLGADFWSDPAQMFRGVAGGADEVDMTPERFAWLQQALRETYKSLGTAGDPVLDRGLLERRIARVNKLYLNGWDDLNGDQVVQKPGECLAGRMQLGEQALTGELGIINNSFPESSGSDRDGDCVPNIASAGVGSFLAGSVHFHAP